VIRKLSVVAASRPDCIVPILEIRNLCKVFQTGKRFQTVLQEIQFDVQPGEMVCILGPSGCGKTTLLRVLAGYLPPDSGDVLLRGEPVAQPGPDRCVVFQEDALFPWLTVEENIAFGLKGRQGSAEEKGQMVKQFLSLVGLDAFGQYLPQTISGGMKQRVALARVLILQPEILLMDEPFAALDAQTREEMHGLLLRLWKQLSHTIIFVTHDVREAVTLADRVMVMEKAPGRIREIVDIDLGRPRSQDTDGFHQKAKILHELLRHS
jgi:NitT/TauT family transport system ATP-binding protein